jgi:hypothetical protein
MRPIDLIRGHQVNYDDRIKQRVIDNLEYQSKVYNEHNDKEADIIPIKGFESETELIELNAA